MTQDSTQYLSRSTAEALDADVRLDSLTWESAIRLLEAQDGMEGYLPDGVFVVDPRNGEKTVFNRSRAARPHDNEPADQTDGANMSAGQDDAGHGAKSGAASRSRPECVICAGRTTSIIDRADLSSGFTFINENLFPVFHPRSRTAAPAWAQGEMGGASYGLHFVQWTSSYHNVDWPELDPGDRQTVIDRLAALEERLLNLPGYPGKERHVSIFKNVGRNVGGSMSHPHQQVALSNTVPRRIEQDAEFLGRTGRSFASYMLEQNPAGLTVAEDDHGRLLVPFCMRRPYELLYVLRNLGRSTLHQTTSLERTSMGGALATGMRLMRAALTRMGRDPAFNVVFHTGRGAGLYLEFLPRSQEEGGFERLGLSACQAWPPDVAAELRALL